MHFPLPSEESNSPNRSIGAATEEIKNIDEKSNHNRNAQPSHAAARYGRRGCQNMSR